MWRPDGGREVQYGSRDVLGVSGYRGVCPCPAPQNWIEWRKLSLIKGVGREPAVLSEEPFLGPSTLLGVLALASGRRMMEDWWTGTERSQGYGAVGEAGAPG